MGRRYDVIVLAGGRARRMSGQAKPQLYVGESTMLERVLSAVPDAEVRIVVGPRQPVPERVLVVRERPAGSGPVAGLAAGLVHGFAPIVVVLAADLPFLTSRAIGALVVALEAAGDADVALSADGQGRDQFLLGAWRRAPLSAALSELTPLPGRAMRELLQVLRVRRVELRHPDGAVPPWTDIDTAEDLIRARRRAWTGTSPLPPGAEQ